MNTHQVFKDYILVKLLNFSSKLIESILSISLYGSANYNPDETKLTQEKDYDIWIIFKKGHSIEAQEFATKLLKTNFRTLSNQVEFILYKKIIIQTSIGKLLLAPMITTEESYTLINKNLHRRGRNILIPWYRPRARERPPKVPFCFKDFVWSTFDMQQEYLVETNLWRLMLPVIIYHNGSISLGTFVECALSGNCFYGNYQKDDELKQKLFIDTIRRLYLIENTKIENIPSEMYKRLTLANKASPVFKENLINQFSQWLYR